ncbi:MAG: hypothetical protein ABMA25_09610 [Ilumatobacteraceae bacterium]
MSDSFEPTPAPFAPPVPTPAYEVPAAPTPFGTSYAPPQQSVVIEVEPSAPPAKRKKWAVIAGIAAVAAVGVGVAVVAGGGDDASKPSVAAFSFTAAADSAQAATNVAYEMNITAGSTGTIEMTGRLDSTNTLMAMNMAIPGVGTTKIDVVLDLANKQMYMSSSAFTEQGLEVDTPWIGIDVSEQPGIEESLAQSTNNPLDVTKAFDQAKSVEEVGIEDFRGEQVKHYIVTISTADALAANPSMQDQIDQLGGEFPDEIVYHVYVTENSQLRRMTYEMEVAGQTISADIILTAVGTMEPIVVPSPDEVTDLSELMGG